MLRADMDALPVEEATGLPYASKVTVRIGRQQRAGVAHVRPRHACRVADGRHALLAEAAEDMERYGHGGLPARRGDCAGRAGMIEDGLFKRFPKPDVVLGQHVMVGPAGTVAGSSGADHVGRR